MKKMFSLVLVCSLVILSQAAYGMLYYQYPTGVLAVDQFGRQCFYLGCCLMQTPPAESSFFMTNPYEQCYSSEHQRFEERFRYAREFFEAVLSDQEFTEFAEFLIENSAKNDAIEIVDRSEGCSQEGDDEEGRIKENPIRPNLREARRLKEKFLSLNSEFVNNDELDRLIEFFCTPLEKNNHIRLSRMLYIHLKFDHHAVEKLCVLSRAFFTRFSQFNGIDRLRWAVKKGLWRLVNKTLKEKIHPNWVVENGGMTALHTSLMNGNFEIAIRLLEVKGIDRKTPNFCNVTPIDFVKEYSGYSDETTIERLICLLTKPVSR